ncbi:MAG: ABC transporter permease [Bacilli bacterium]|nr:ABC transporter permease [Bacilli bacterium]
MENTLNTFSKRVKSMIAVDFKRMFKSRLFYIMLGIAIIVPILVVVMTSMMDGTVTTDQYGNPVLDEFGNPVLMEGFKSAWECIGSTNESQAMGMDLTSMCNINLVYFGIAVFICLFVSEDFRSGYAKNLFTVRSKKNDYVISKIIVGFVTGALMLILFFIGSMIASAMMGLSFDLGSLTGANIFMCLLSKVLLMGVFSAIFVLISVCVKQKAWLGICLSLGGGMLLFMMIPMMTPLNAGVMNVFLCLAGGLMFSFGLGTISNLILNKISLV